MSNVLTNLAGKVVARVDLADTKIWKQLSYYKIYCHFQWQQLCIVTGKYVGV